MSIELDERLLSVSREVLKELTLLRDWHTLYAFHAKYGVLPGDLLEICEILSSKGLIDWQQTRIRLTEEGQRWVIRNREDIFLTSRARQWRLPPAGLFKKPLAIYAPYMPKSYAENGPFFDNFLNDDLDS